MAYQGEYFVERYGLGAAEATPPIARMLEMGIKVSAGTDATRVASYNPWVSPRLAGHRHGRSVVCGSTRSATAWTVRRRCGCGPRTLPGSRNEEGKKGRIVVGQLADLIVPDRDYFACAGG